MSKAHRSLIELSAFRMFQRGKRPQQLQLWIRMHLAVERARRASVV